MSVGQRFSYFCCISLLMGVAITNARVHPTSINVFQTIHVDPSGRGNFTNIQSAIDSVPSKNNDWIYIYVSAGTCKEQVKIPMDKPFIYLQGEGEGKTSIVWDASDSISTSATFSVYADNIVAKGLAFVNSYNSPANPGNPRKAAVAATIEGDKCSFYQCRFVGLQDTLRDAHGRHCFYLSTIVGAVDFIFGAGQSIYERCTISVSAGALNGVVGFITAQGRSNSADTNGFVFKECSVNGTGKVFLGRPWRDFARVLYFNSTLSDFIVPQGWDVWGSVHLEYQITFAEHACNGAGSDTWKRISWEKNLSDQELQQLTSISFIDNEGWISRQPN